VIDRVHIEDAAALERLGGRIAEFAGRIGEAKHHVEANARKTLDYLGERYSLWKRRYEAYRDEADRLWGQLERCAETRLDQRSRSFEIPRKCTGIFEAYQEACRRRDEADANMTICDGLIESVQSAGDAFRRQMSSLERQIGDEVAASRKTLAERARRARALAAHTMGSPLTNVMPAAFSVNDGAPLGGTAAPPVARWGAGIGASVTGAGVEREPVGAALPPEPHGPHETSRGEGAAKEGPPNPDGSEGPVRLDVEPERDREPPDGWRPDGERM
jgi:hypothetical protein